MKHLSFMFLLLAGIIGPIESSAAAERIYVPMSPAEVRSRIQSWVEDQGLSETQRSLVTTMLTDASSMQPSQLVELAIRCFAIVDSELSPFAQPTAVVDFNQYASLSQRAARPIGNIFVTSNLHAYLGRSLAEQRFYDEALKEFAAVDLRFAIDPAAVLFYKAVAAQETLAIPEALTALGQLLDQTERVPSRYLTVAELMRDELQGLQPQSLGQIARLMNDSERRLDLGRAGEQVQEVQDRIIADLDELIKKLEAQQGGGGGSGSGSSNSNQSSSAADDSRVKGATAPGETDDKKFSKDGRWGDLPEKEQAAAKNLINRDFPSHYRQAIEMYFKKLAGRPAPQEK